MGLLEFVVLALASYRVTRLLIADDFPPVAKLRERLLLRFPFEGQILNGADGTARQSSGTFLGDLVTCPWCLGFWVAAVAWLCYEVAVDGMNAPWAFRLAVPWALSAVVGLIWSRE